MIVATIRTARGVAICSFLWSVLFTNNETDFWMNWQLVLEMNRTALLGLVSVMLSMLPDGAVMARAAKRRMLAILLPSEACLRRLIVIVTRTMEAPVVTARAASRASTPRGKASVERAPVFGLFDPRRRVEAERTRRHGAGPRVGFFDEWTPQGQKSVPADEDELDFASLRHRIAAMQRALDDVPGQAQRLMQIIARRKLAGNRKVKVMRPGRPPGHREGGKREVDEMLAGLNYLALWVLVEPPPDWVMADGN